MEPEDYNRFTQVWTGLAPQNPLTTPASSEPTSNPPTWSVTKPDAIKRNLNPYSDPTDPTKTAVWNISQPPSRDDHVIYDPAFAYFPRFSWGGRAKQDDDDDNATPRPIENAVYPYPNLTLPHPSLNLDFRMSIRLGERIPVGSSPLGKQTWISFTGGTWSGSWGTGVVQPGGQDSETTTSNGSTHLDAKFLLQTHETPPAFITVKASGWMTGPADVLAKLSNPDTVNSVDANDYKFRLSIELETADERYRGKINCGMWVGSGMKRKAEIIFDVYRIV